MIIKCHCGQSVAISSWCHCGQSVAISYF